MNILKNIVIALIVILIASFLLIEIIIIAEGNKTYNGEVDYVFILGARLYGDVPSPSLIERLKVSTAYLKEHESSKVVVCGGQGKGETIPEAEAMKDYLIKNGIDGERIIVEDESVNTFENIKFGLEKIKEFDDRDDLKVLIATSKFHIFRSKLIAKRLGLIPFPLPAKVPPSSIIKSYTREYFGVIKSFFIDK